MITFNKLTKEEVHNIYKIFLEYRLDEEDLAAVYNFHGSVKIDKKTEKILEEFSWEKYCRYTEEILGDEFDSSITGISKREIIKKYNKSW